MSLGDEFRAIWKAATSNKLQARNATAAYNETLLLDPRIFMLLPPLSLVPHVARAIGLYGQAGKVIAVNRTLPGLFLWDRHRSRSQRGH